MASSWGTSWGTSWGDSWGTTGGGGGGSTVLFYNGVSMAGSVTQHGGISRPQVSLTDAGGGTYNVTKKYEEYDFKADGVNRETYLIDGELP